MAYVETPRGNIGRSIE